MHFRKWKYGGNVKKILIFQYLTLKWPWPWPWIDPILISNLRMANVWSIKSKTFQIYERYIFQCLYLTFLVIGLFSAAILDAILDFSKRHGVSQMIPVVLKTTDLDEHFDIWLSLLVDVTNLPPFLLDFLANCHPTIRGSNMIVSYCSIAGILYSGYLYNV